MRTIAFRTRAAGVVVMGWMILLGMAALPRMVSAAQASRQPNIVFILADDLGWSDTSLYGSRYYETPNIDRLAQRGVMFSQAYAASPICSPTRASIMTGLYPGRVGITVPVCHMPEPRLQAQLFKAAPPHLKALQYVSANRLSTDYPTLAKSLKEAGYITGHFGKWHLGLEPYDPLHHGFDVDVPHWWGPGPAGSYVAPWKFPPRLNFTGQEGEHIEDRMAQEAIRFIKANKDRPFFLNYWAFSVHAPFDGKKELIEKYTKKADPNSPQHYPVYAAMVQSLDENVGRLMDALDREGLADNTIVIFFSDNGGVHWTAGQETAGKPQIPVTSNAPLRGGKATLYEGGTREPCIVIWPGRIKGGTKSDAFLCSVDWYPTLLEMAGLKPKMGQKLDGVSQVPALLGTGAPRDTLYCFFPHYTPRTGSVPGTWVRRGDWKLIRLHHDGPDQADRFELYNLSQDIGETVNLADRMPGKVKELNALIDAHLAEIGAFVPKKNPRYDPAAQPPPEPAPGRAPAKRTPQADLRLQLEEAGDRNI